MVDRDPITEPAGDIIAAQTLLDVLDWVESGGEDRYDRLSAVLLQWKGRRLRDAIAEAGVNHLGQRVAQLAPEAEQALIERLCRAAGLVLSGDALCRFIDDMVALRPSDQPFRTRRLNGLRGLSDVLVQRSDRDTREAGVKLLRMRAEVTQAGNLDGDDRLAEHLYRSHAQSNVQDTVAFLRSWFVANASYESSTKHRVLRSAVVAGHWDVVLALFVAGTPCSAQALARTVPAEGGSQPLSLGTFLVRRIRLLEPRVLTEATEIAMQHLVAGSGSRTTMLGWCLYTAEEAAAAGVSIVEAQSLRAALSAVRPESDEERNLVEQVLQQARRLPDR